MHFPHPPRDGAAAGSDLRAAWRLTLRRHALALFDEAAPIPIDSFATAPRISRARRNLGFALDGFGRQGKELFDLLHIALPETRAKTKGKAA